MSDISVELETGGAGEAQEPEVDPFSDAGLAARVRAEQQSDEPEAETAEETEARPPAQPRDEQGRFAREAERPEWLPQNYRTVEDFVRGHEELKGLVDRMGNELGEMRAQVQQPQAPPPPGAIDFDQYEESEIPQVAAQVAESARRRGDAFAYNQAMQAWYDFDPRGASGYERSLEIQALRQEFGAQLGAVAGPAAEDRFKRETASVHRTLSERFPQLADESFVERMMEIAPQSEIVKMALSGELTPQMYEEVVEILAIKAGATPGAPAEAAPHEPPVDKTTLGVASPSSASGAAGDTKEAAIQRFKQSIIDAPL